MAFRPALISLLALLLLSPLRGQDLDFDSLLIREIQPEGKKRMEVQAYLCGFTFPIGERFT